MRPHKPVRLNPEELERLVKAAQREGGKELNNLLRAIRAPLLGYFMRRLPADEADDLAQLALLRVARALPRIDADRASAFVGTVARNLLRTAQRRMARDARRFTYNDAIDSIESISRADEAVEHHEVLAAIQSVSVRALPAELRDIVDGLLRGLSYAEIAVTQGVRQVTVRTRLLRVRAILREELKQYGTHPSDLRAPPGDSHSS
jgi:RNA polymerase sigma factor (sigma-70 family)